jgi:exodeoxyribonuclease-3
MRRRAGSVIVADAGDRPGVVLVVSLALAGAAARTAIAGPPRLLQDGSLGKRELDHRWKGDAAAGGVKYSDLPPSVVARLRSYITANHLAVPPQ